MNPIRLFRRRNPKPQPQLLAVTPPRTGERTLLGVENMLGSIAAPEPFSLEIAGTSDGVTLMARCAPGSAARRQIAAHYPQARVRDVPPAEDPLRLAEGELAWRTTLGVDGPVFLPLRTFRDDDLLDAGSDPLLALVGAMSGLDVGERVVARLRLSPLGPDWSKRHLDRANSDTPLRSPSYTYQTHPIHMDAVGLASLGIMLYVGLQSYVWIEEGRLLGTILLDGGMVLGAALAGWLAWRWLRGRTRFHDPRLIGEKVSRAAFLADVEVVAVLPQGGREQRAGEILDAVTTAYRHYDNPAGARFKAGRTRPATPDASPQRRSLNPFRRPGVLGVREVAALWHPPGAADETPHVERGGAATLLPSPRGVRSGAWVGTATGAATSSNIYFPDDLLRRHHLYLARTRMGKSTLMGHVVAHKLREKAAGRDDDAIVVVDPHADLVDSLLDLVPEDIADRVRLLDLSDSSRYPGINLLDTRLFTDRDRTADSVVRVARGLWEQWGPRMQSILEHTVKSLHEANSHGSVTADTQYTILDGLKLLSDQDFRGRVLGKVRDPYLLQWWSRDFGGWNRQYRADALAPVQTRLAYYASSKRARAILGQSRSTIDMRSLISEGGVLFVSTAQGVAGRDVAALVGSSVLNLVDAVIREQGGLPPEQRRGALVVVDEMQSMPGVDYESMLSELGKFGASFVLATQSLSKLDDLSPTMRDTVLANVGCLAVFQVAAQDAQKLVWELDRDRLSEEDLASQRVHNCYVRATVGKERFPTYSMSVRPPEDVEADTAARIRAGVHRYTVDAREIADREAQAARLAKQVIRGMAEGGGGKKGRSRKKDDSDPDSQKNQRSRHADPGAATGRAPAENGADE